MATGKEPEVIDADAMLPVARAAQIDQLNALVFAVPEAEDAGDGLDVALRVIGARNWEQVNLDDAKLPQSKDLVGQTYTVRKLTRRQSDKDGWSQWYFVVDSDHVGTGRPFRWSTGSAVIMAQLATLHAMRKLPATVTITETATRSGQKALQLHIDAAG